MAKTNRRTVRDRVRSRVDKGRSGGFGAWNLPEGFKKFKMEKEGVVRLDILPYIVTKLGNPEITKDDVGDQYYERTFFTHNIRNGENFESVACLSKNWNKRCPVCEYVKRMKEEDATGNKLEIDGLKPKERQLFNVIDIANPDQLQIMEVGYWKSFGELLEDKIKAADPEDGADAFVELQGGKTLKISYKQDKWAGGTFIKAFDIAFKDREDYDAEILDRTADLDSLLIERSYSEIEAMLFGIGQAEETAKPAKTVKPIKRGPPPEGSDDEPPPARKLPADDDEPPPPVRRREQQAEPAPARRAAPPPADDDEPPVAPAPRRRASTEEAPAAPVKRPPPPPADDDEPPPPPARRRAPAAEEAPAPARRAAPATADDDEPPPPVRKKPAAVAAPAPDTDDDPPPARPAKKPAAACAGVCPFKHTFGADCDEFDECDDCPTATWTACDEAKK